MKKRLQAIIMAVVLIISAMGTSFIPVHFAKAATEITVKLHYHRIKDDYKGWNVWCWPEGGDGAAYQFTGQDDYGKVATYKLQVPNGVTKAGFIIRLNEWEKKDTNDDRFIDLTKAKNGVVDVYVLQDEPKFGYGENEMNLGPKIMEANMTSTTTIDFTVSTKFDSTSKNTLSKLKVKDSAGKEYAISSLTSKGGTKATNGTITMKDKLDMTSSLTLYFDGYGNYPVSTFSMFSSKEFEDAFYYDGDDLGAIWSKDKTNFRVWAPTASEVKVNLYKTGDQADLIETVPMTKDVKGTWIVEKTGDLNGTYYTYSVTVNGTTNEAVDPYAKAVGVNGDRGMVINLDSTNPDGFADQIRPAFGNSTDAVIYELHIRDFSNDKSSGMKNKGKYLAFTETGTTTTSGQKTGVDYLKDLGITHVQLQPSFDFATIDEKKLDTPQFNWGYDPKNYNVPEGSYSTDPYKGEVRVNEYKQMVQSLHKNGIRVVMDVVYNHTSASSGSNLNKIVPGFYYRMNAQGGFSNASGCGNETASERAMVRKLIVDSVVYWATEYKVDGFRFDLMGIHDKTTMNDVRAALDKVDPSIILYGEGWTGGSSVYPESDRAMKASMNTIDSRIGAFCDDLRDGIKGSVFNATDKGFVTGKSGVEESIKFGIVAATKNSQINYKKVNYSSAPWAAQPTQTINYTSAHDNLTLWDKISTSNAKDSLKNRIKMNLLSSAIVFTSQGTPFFLEGEEILRSKPTDKTGKKFDSNSYKSSDFTNNIKWDTVATNIDVYNYYKGLIAFRKAHSALRMTKTSDIQANLKFMKGLDAKVIGYTINNSPNNETAKSICVIFNANKKSTKVKIPSGSWNVYVKGNKAGTKVLEKIKGGSVTVAPISTLICVKE